MSDEFVARKAIYRQDCEFYRHNDLLKWSRLKMAVAAEAGTLMAVHGLGGADMDRRLVMLAGFFLVFLFCLMAVKDEIDENGHERRLAAFEERYEKFVKSGWPVTGTKLLYVMTVSLNLFNVVVGFVKWQ